jgi:hypothetical protein
MIPALILKSYVQSSVALQRATDWQEAAYGSSVLTGPEAYSALLKRLATELGSCALLLPLAISRGLSADPVLENFCGPAQGIAI